MRKLMMAALAAAMMTGPAIAQRDPAYAQARAEGKIGEQPDGYLGIVGEATPQLKALVSNINIQRKKIYTESAPSGATIEQFAFTSGCNLILKTVAGEKYQTPSGQWKTRTAAAPERDPRCV